MTSPSMLFRSIGVIDPSFNYAAGRFVGVRDGVIDYIGADEPETGAYDEVYDGTGKLLMPALVNAHAHAPMTLLRGYAEGLALDEWLNGRVFPFEARIDAEAARAACDLAIAEMARFGCVSFSDMYYFDEARCASVLDAGVKCNLSGAIVAFDAPSYAATPQAALNERLFRDWDGAGGGRIKIDVAIHAEYTNNDTVCREAAEAARENGAIVHVHASETRSEVEGCRARHGGLSPIAYFEKLGVLDGPVLAAHCVWVDDADIDILVSHGTSVACNPASNLKLASGFAPVPELLRRKVNVALGTDGPASNNAHDLFRDMYLFATVYKGAWSDPTAVTCAEAINAATRAGALAQGRTDCGLIERGMRADLAVLDIDRPWMAPATDVVANLVYSACGSDVVLTMCDGRVVYRDGIWPTVDVERAMREVERHTDRIISSLAKAGE